MKIIHLHQVIFLAILYLTNSSLQKEPPNIKSGKLELLTKFQDTTNKMLYPLQETIEQADKIVLSAHTIHIHYPPGNAISIIGWEISFDELSKNVILHLPFTPSKS